MFNEAWTTIRGSREKVLFAAVAMMAGAKIDEDKMSWLKRMYRSYLSDEEAEQMEKALENYQAGQLWDSESPGLMEAMLEKAHGRANDSTSTSTV